MGTRAKWLVLGGIATMSIALVHCVGDDPTTAPGGGGDAGGDSDLNIGETSIGPDTSTVTDAGLDANICTSNADVTCGTGVSPCIIQISGGGQNFCARDNKCKVYCWGDNRDGQLGTPPTTVPFSATPLAVSFGGKLAAGVDISGPDLLASTAYTVACARVTAVPGTPTSVMCWGGDEYGQIAIDPDASTVSVNDAGRRYVPTPTDIPGVSAATYIGVGETHECAITSSFALECWGDNTYGELARDTGGVNTNPVPGPAGYTGGSAGAEPDAVTIGYQHMCTTNGSVSANDRVACVGRDESDQLGRDGGPNGTLLNAVLPMTNANAIAAAKSTTCAINKTGAVVCWGDNTYGESGDGVASAALVGNPTMVPSLNGGVPAVGLAAGTNQFCVLLKVPDPGDGGVAQNVYCWGRNEVGEAVPNAANPVLVPAPVAGLPARAAAIAAGSQASCALITDGTVYCWGENYVGELGNGDPGDGGISGPVKVTF
jgi:hypothetical protein